MSNKLDHYELSEEADAGLDKIFDYTENKHSFNQAVKYLTDLDTIFEALVVNLEIGRVRNEIRQELYSISEQEHIVFYRIIDNYVRIVRVLYGSKDIPKLFKE